MIVCECKCGHKFDIENNVVDWVCPKCGSEKWKRITVLSEGTKGVKRTGEHIVLSNALGINPAQIKAATRLNPDEEYAPDGRMVLKSDRHREKMAKRYGMVIY